MQTLINGLLAYSRIGSDPDALRPTDCEQVLQAALMNLQPAIADSAALITHEPLPTLDAADATQLVQLFQNLIGNAIKFHGKDTPQIRIRAEPQDAFWCFSVRDNGIGIPPENLGDVFTMFHRLHTESEYPGTGIGLAICKRVVERHGGRIWVESVVGSGATFRFTLPK